MIVAVGSSNRGGPLVILGLSDENWERMRHSNAPILRQDLTLMGLPVDLVMIAGPTEDAIEAKLAEWFELDKKECDHDGHD